MPGHLRFFFVIFCWCMSGEFGCYTKGLCNTMKVRVGFVYELNSRCFWRIYLYYLHDCMCTKCLKCPFHNTKQNSLITMWNSAWTSGSLSVCPFVFRTSVLTSCSSKRQLLIITVYLIINVFWPRSGVEKLISVAGDAARLFDVDPSINRRVSDWAVTLLAFDYATSVVKAMHPCGP